jgi:NAD(P)-dependent dehydrogenase (short-subunit alcohol dehydrogenase family)
MTDVLVVIGIGGMGETIARREAPGRTTVLADFNQAALDVLETSMTNDGFDVRAIRVDVSSRESVEDVARFAATLGAVKYLVHTAGLSPAQAPLDAILRVDLVGVGLVLEAFGAIVTPGTAGVVISSSSSYLQPGFTAEEQAQIRAATPEGLLELPLFLPDTLANHTGIAYGRAKLANRIQVQAASVGAWGAAGARITTVSPGVISTAMGRQELAEPSGAFMRSMVENSGAARLGTPSDIADAVTFLLGPQASFITGIDLLVDGGVVAAVATGKVALPEA